MSEFRVTVHPRKEVDPAAEAELQRELQQEANSRVQQSSEQVSTQPVSATTEVQATTQHSDIPPIEQQTNPQSDITKQVQQALVDGYSRDEIVNFLSSSKGFSEDDADLTVVSALKDQVKAAKSDGYTEDEILNHLVSIGIEGKLADNAISAARIVDKGTNIDYKQNLTEEEKATELADLYRNIYSKYSTQGKALLGLFDDSKAIEARREVNQLNYAISERLKKEGLNTSIDPDSGEVMLINKQGVKSVVDSSFLGSLSKSKGEMLGAIAGGVAGAVAGPIGSVAGAAVGASLGSGIDMAINASKLSEDISTKLYLSHMAQAGVSGAVLDSTVGLSVKGVKTLYKGLKYVTHGNPGGAYRALKKDLNLSDDAIKEIVQNFEKLNGKLNGSTVDKAIQAVSLTYPGATNKVRSAAAISDRVASVLKQQIDDRAKSLHKAVNSFIDENIGNAVRKDLISYQQDVKDFYSIVKNQASETIDGTDFRFDLSKIAIEPVMEVISKKLSNPIAKEQFVNYASRIEAASLDRTFSGLIDLRAIVNEFKGSKVLIEPDRAALNTVISNIDKQISKAANLYLPDGSAWLNNFAKAKNEYSKMKVLQENTLFRLITRKGATEQNIQQALSRYGKDTEVDSEMFNSVITRLSSKNKTSVESAAVSSLVNKHTVGNNFKAIDFPSLAEDLNKLNTTSKQVGAIKDVVNEFAKVYKNDVDLGKVTGNIITDVNTSFAQSIEGKIRVALISSIWNPIYKYFPTDRARGIALAHLTEKLLSNPLELKTVDQFLRSSIFNSKSIPESTKNAVSSLVKELQVEVAKSGPVEKPIEYNMYKQTTNGKLTMSKGMLGEGLYLVDKVKEPIPGRIVLKYKVNHSKIATLDDISKLVGKPVSVDKINKLPGIKEQLSKAGYHGIRYEDKVMLFVKDKTKEGKK